ncbi:MAG: hypothetical protein AB1540_12165 [Bdellovibrionota bacterium]
MNKFKARKYRGTIMAALLGTLLQSEAFGSSIELFQCDMQNLQTGELALGGKYSIRVVELETPDGRITKEANLYTRVVRPGTEATLTASLKESKNKSPLTRFFETQSEQVRWELQLTGRIGILTSKTNNPNISHERSMESFLCLEGDPRPGIETETSSSTAD